LPHHYQNISDAELLENFYNDHDNKWLGILLPRYTLSLLGVCMKYLKNEEDARDCVQQVFLKVINELHKYKVDYFKSWIYMVAKNHCLMKLRSNKNVEVELNEQTTAIELDTNHQDPAEKEKTLSKLQECLLKLNKEQRQCIHLFYLEKKTYSEIADATGFPVQQVKSYLQNGKRNLKLMMEEM
jgi:RNA polymerase sigma-70 factor (ECF subfamily)